MSWEELYQDTKRLANQAAKKISHAGDIASLQIQLSIAEEKLEEAFATLGKTCYLHFTTKKNCADAVAKAIDDVKRAKVEVASLRAQIEQEKARDKTE